MFSSTNENNGFSAIEQEELENVNGGSPFNALQYIIIVSSPSK